MDARGYRKRCGRCGKLAPEAEIVRIARPVMRWEKVDEVPICVNPLCEQYDHEV